MSAIATELWAMSAGELAGAIRSRRVSCREVVEEHLRRMDAVNSAVNAVPVVLAKRAREAADAADRLVSARRELPPLHGVPFVVKSNIDVAGTPTTQGIRTLADAYPTVNAPIVDRMEAAGAIVIGRTNMPNLAIRWHCDSELYGHTANPWDRSRTAGGSSAGVAAAVATGMSPLGLGNDGLGSLRHPAQCCGVAALKPTLGRVPDDSTAPGAGSSPIGAQLMCVNGPLARRVADLRSALEVIAGPTWRDPWSVAAPLSGSRLTRPIRVAVVYDPAGAGTDKQVQDGVRRAARALAGAGYVLDEIEPPCIDAVVETGLAMLNTPEWRATWELGRDMMPPDTRLFLAQFYAAAGDADPVTTVQSFIRRHALLRAWGQFQQEYPLIVAPVCTEMPFIAGSDISHSRVAEEIRSMRMTIAVNALGLPAVAVPVGAADGLPQGVQVIGPRYREDLCLDAGEAIEEAVGILTPIDPQVGDVLL